MSGGLCHCVSRIACLFLTNSASHNSPHFSSLVLYVLPHLARVLLFLPPPDANVLLWVITYRSPGFFLLDLPGPSMVDSLRSHAPFIFVGSHVRTSPPSQTVNARVTDLFCSFYCSLASSFSLSLFAFFCSSMSLVQYHISPHSALISFNLLSIYLLLPDIKS